MSPSKQRAILLISFLLVATATAVGAVSSVTRNGLISVRVRDSDGTHVNLHVPSAAVWAALPFVPDEVFQHGSHEVVEWSPLAQEALEKLGDCEDFTLVSVEAKDETVSIRKRDQNLEVHVEGGGSDIHITLPLDTARLVLRRLEDANRDA